MKASPHEFSLPVVLGGCLAAAALGWFVRDVLGMVESSVSTTRRGVAQRIAEAGNAAGPWKAPATDGGFAHLQAVTEHFSGGSAVRLPALGSLATEEAEELASQLQGEALAARSVADPEAFLTEAAHGDYRFRNSALTAWAERNPEGFQAVLKSRRIADWDATPVFTAMARRDPAKMQAWLESPPDIPASRLEAAWTSVLKVWAEQDTAGLQAKLATLGKRAGAAAIEVGETMAGKDPAAAVEWARSLPEKSMSQEVLARIVNTLGQTNPEKAAEYIEEVRHHSIWNVGYQWSYRDPEGALRWLSEHPDSPLKDCICDYSLKKVAATNAAAAQSFLTSLPAGGQMNAIGQIASGMAESDPAAALRWATALPDEKLRQNALKMAALANRDESLMPQFAALVPEAAPGMFFETDPAAAARSLAALPPEQQQAAWNLMNGSAQTEPAACAGLVEALPEGTLRSSAASRVASFWSAADPSAAAAWIARLPEGESRVWATENLLNNWARYDLSHAQTWTDALSPGPAKDKAVAILEKVTSPGAKK